MVFVIDDMQPNIRAQKILDEVDALVKFTGRKPEKVALFPQQFDYVKRSCLLAKKREIRTKLKLEAEGERLKRGLLDLELEKNGFMDDEDAEVLSWNGITLYDKTQPVAQGNLEC